MDQLLDIPLTNKPTNQSSQKATSPTNTSSQSNQPNAVTIDPLPNEPEQINDKTNTSNQPANPPTSSAKPKINLPEINQMEQALLQKGILLNEIKIDTGKSQPNNTPLASLQPDNMLQTKTGPQPINLPSVKEKPLQDITLATTQQEEKGQVSDQLKNRANQIKKVAKNIVAIALTLQGLKGIYGSIKFILFDYPALETQLLAHQIGKSQVNSYATHAILILISTIIGMFFALKIMRSKAVKVVNIVIGVGLFFGSAYVSTYLTSHFDLTTLISSPVLTIFNLLKKIPDLIIKILPFVQKNSAGQLEVVWYQ